MQGIDNDNDGRLKEFLSVLRGAKEGFLTRGGTEQPPLVQERSFELEELLLPLHPAGNSEASCIESESNTLNPQENWAVLKHEMIPNND